ncbi:hypothetical protein HanPSC8_Chr07g0269801 [Helianthus annuus]|nr:hypothetical protein HanPSC8_Chr07g0269801 [Helianthus annuus]
MSPSFVFEGLFLWVWVWCFFVFRLVPGCTNKLILFGTFCLILFGRRVLVLCSYFGCLGWDFVVWSPVCCVFLESCLLCFLVVWRLGFCCLESCLGSGSLNLCWFVVSLMSGFAVQFCVYVFGVWVTGTAASDVTPLGQLLFFHSGSFVSFWVLSGGLGSVVKCPNFLVWVWSGLGLFGCVDKSLRGERPNCYVKCIYLFAGPSLLHPIVPSRYPVMKAQINWCLDVTWPNLKSQLWILIFCAMWSASGPKNRWAREYIFGWKAQLLGFIIYRVGSLLSSDPSVWPKCWLIRLCPVIIPIWKAQIWVIEFKAVGCTKAQTINENEDLRLAWACDPVATDWKALLRVGFVCL